MLSHWPGLCSNRCQWFEVIWTWWWSECFIFTTVPLQPVRDTPLDQLLYITAFWWNAGFSDPDVAHEKDRAGWRCVCAVFVFHVFNGRHLLCVQGKTSDCEYWEEHGRSFVDLSVCGGGYTHSFLLQSHRFDVRTDCFPPGAERQQFPSLQCGVKHEHQESGLLITDDFTHTCSYMKTHRLIQARTYASTEWEVSLLFLQVWCMLYSTPFFISWSFYHLKPCSWTWL